MTDKRDRFDRDLSERLDAAEQRIDVQSAVPDPARVATRGLVAGTAILTATAAAAVVVAVLLIGRLPDRSTGDASPSPAGDVSAQARNGEFMLMISSPQSVWTTQDAIEVTATLNYSGSEREVTIWGGAGPVEFSLRQLEGGTAELSGGQELPCIGYPVAPDAPLVWPFAKAGGVDHGAPFDRAFFEEPELHLPPGRWQVSAVLVYDISECSGQPLRLEVSIELDVIEADASAGPTVEPTQTPEPQTATPMPTAELRSSWETRDLTNVVRQTDPELAYASISGISEARGILFATGRAARSTPGIWWSPDGIRWHLAKVPDAPEPYGFTVQQVVDAGPRFVAIADGGLAEGSGVFTTAIYVSADGRNWRNADSIPAVDQGAHRAIAQVGDRLFALGTSVWASDDAGLTWDTTVTHEELGGDVLAVATGTDVLLAVGPRVGSDLVETPSYGWVSTDGGETWKRTMIDAERVLAAAVILDDGTLLAFGDGVVWTSADDGASWTSSSIPLACCGVAAVKTPTAIVAIQMVEGEPSGAAVSHDGIAWTNGGAVPLPIRDVTWGPQFGLVAVGQYHLGFGPNPMP